MRDEEHRGALLASESRHVVEDDPLHRDVESRGRLVGDEQLGIRRQADADQRALTHATGELVRELVQASLGVAESGLLQHLDRSRLDVLLAAGDPVGADRLLHLEADAPYRVEVRHGVLGHKADLPAADGLDIAAPERGQLASAEGDRTARDRAGAREQVDDGAGGRGLARPGLAHDGDGLAGEDVEARAVQDLAEPVLCAERDLEVAHAQQGHLVGSAFAHRRALALGSMASRMSSPRVTNASTASVSAIDG